jgi:two-component system OmpR family response regulator
MMKILVVEDDKNSQEFIVKGLKENGHVVFTADNGKDGLFLALEEKLDLIILDRMLPKLDGLSVLTAIRGTQSKLPIIMLTAMGEVKQRVEGLTAGADDYLTKPFAFSELLARIDAIKRRSGVDNTQTSLKIADLEINLLSHRVTRSGQFIELQSTEYRLLRFLVEHQDQVVTRTMLLEHVWDYSFDPQTNIIDVHISRLRAKIDKNFAIPLIQTVRGAGYMIKGLTIDD